MQIELRGNRWSVRYYYKGKHIRVTDPKWTKEVGKRQMQRIAEEAVRRDIERREQDAKDLEDIENSTGRLGEMFLDQCELSCKKQTAYQKRSRWHRHIEPCFDMDIRPERSLTNEKVQAFRMETASKVGASAANHILALFREYIDYLCVNGHLDFQTGARLKALCSPVNSTGRAKDSENFWTAEEWNRFIATFDCSDIQGFCWKTYFETSYWCALRLGEALGLKYSDFDFDRMTLTVQRSIDPLGNVTLPKTASSNATIQVRREVIEDLKKYRMIQGGKDDDYVFTVGRTSVRRHMYEHAKEAGVKQITPHGLRHSMASRMINSGVNILVVSRQLRHASPDQTLHTYSHLFPNTDRGAIDKL